MDTSVLTKHLTIDMETLLFQLQVWPAFALSPLYSTISSKYQLYKLLVSYDSGLDPKPLYYRQAQ